MVVGVAVVVLVAAGGVGLWYVAFRDRGPADDLGRLQGEWKVSAGGRADVGLVRVEGDLWTYVSGGRERTSHRITLNPAASPKEIDLTRLDADGRPVTFTHGPGTGAEVKQLGVYALDGDTLRVVLAPEQEGPRPKSLDDPDGPPALALTRAKK